VKLAMLGQPGCGRTTLFRALAGDADADPSRPLTVKVPDRRLEFLASVTDARKAVHATVVFVDLQSPAFSPRNLSAVQDAAALVVVVDNFALGHPARDLMEAEADLLVADLALVEKRMERLRKESRRDSPEHAALERARAALEDDRPLRTAEVGEADMRLLRAYSLHTLRPLMVVSNRGDEPAADEAELRDLCEERGAALLPIDAAFELELTELPEEEHAEFLQSMGYRASGLDRLISAAYGTLDLVTFFTIGEDEVRAWPVKRGSTAPQAAGAVHTDMQRGFIRAKVIPFETYRECPDEAELRSRGEVRLEGKDYVVREGDILEIRFSV